jgi:hypothetical protein
MKLWIALTVAIVFLAPPLVCIAMPCDFAVQAHDCCPKSRGVVACPYDVLETAKAAQPQADPALSTAPFSLQPCVTAPSVVRNDPAAFEANGRDLHTRVRVLLI